MNTFPSQTSSSQNTEHGRQKFVYSFSAVGKENPELHLPVWNINRGVKNIISV